MRGIEATKCAAYRLRHGAISYWERQQWPKLGLSVTRRALRTLAARYNDEVAQCLVCFVCGEQRVTLAGPEHPGYESMSGIVKQRRPIHRYSSCVFDEVERACPGTLLNNGSYALWRKRYVGEKLPGKRREAVSARQPTSLGARQASADKPSAEVEEWAPTITPPGPSVTNPIADWAVRVSLHIGRTSTLFGCTEDITCNAAADTHAAEHMRCPFCCAKLCAGCRVPLCRECYFGLGNFDSASRVGPIPMSIAYRNYYGYVNMFLVKHQVTWLEWQLRRCVGAQFSCIILKSRSGI